ncbi:unnamed protein product [Thlaspi arvense]|uniref:Separase n=1 Tax=Thlaspi arvense TaxID=13288 RepID=A0AAU9SR03_THLAR|nr:unnamed protein product [Thlaspi arvense]
MVKDRALTTRSIANQFLPFISKSISSLHKRLSVTVPAPPDDLFRAYEFCLECCELVSHDPHAVQLQRLALIRCYQHWGWFTHASNDGMRFLEGLRAPGLSSDMGKCALSIIREAERFDKGFVQSFCNSTLKEYYKSPLPKCHFYKFSRQVLSLLFMSKETETSQPVETVMSVLRTVACEIKVEPGANWLEFLDLVSYCVHESLLAGDVWCAGVSKQLSEIASNYYNYKAIPQANLILRLYSAGLPVHVFDVKLRKIVRKKLRLEALLGDDEIWNSSVSLWGLIQHYHKDAVEYTPPYLDALKFLCQPLASLINSEKKKMVPGRVLTCYTAHLSVIQDIFLQFCHGLREFQRWTHHKECSGTDFNKTLLNVAMAASFISMRTQYRVEVKYLLTILTNQVEALFKLFFLQECLKITGRLVEDVIASPWISPPDLKYLLASFHDIGVAFYSMKNLGKASLAFKICIRTVWTCVRLLCQIHVKNERKPSEECLSREAIIDFASKACGKSAFYLDVLQQHGAPEINKLLVFILENWSAAEALIKNLPDPTPIAKQYVKTQRRDHEIQKEEKDLKQTGAMAQGAPLHSRVTSNFFTNVIALITIDLSFVLIIFYSSVIYHQKLSILMAKYTTLDKGIYARPILRFCGLETSYKIWVIIRGQARDGPDKKEKSIFRHLLQHAIGDLLSLAARSWESSEDPVEGKHYWPSSLRSSGESPDVASISGDGGRRCELSEVELLDLVLER